MEDNKYINKGTNALALINGESIHKIIDTVRDLLISEAKDRNITPFKISDIMIHKYPCKCLFAADGYVKDKSFSVTGSEADLIHAYISLRQQIFGKYLR